MSLPTPLEKMRAQTLAWEMLNDRRAIFLNCYAQMTQNTFHALDSGDFHDPVWVQQLLNRFSEYYFVALESYNRAKPNPLVWQITFDAATHANLTTVQHLFLGVNAHINYDLVLTLFDLLHSDWADLTPAIRLSRYEDYLHINTIVAGTIDRVQDTVVERYTPAMDWVDNLLGPLDEWLTAKMITRWRETVWENALKVLTAQNEETRIQLCKEIEAHSLRRAKWISMSK